MKLVGFACSWSQSKNFIKSYKVCIVSLQIKSLMVLITKLWFFVRDSEARLKEREPESQLSKLEKANERHAI